MGDADLFVRLAHRLVAQPTVKTLGAALRAQHHAAVAPLGGGLLQRLYHLAAHTGAAQRAVHRHAADARRVRLRLAQQAAGAHRHAQPVEHHGMHGVGVQRVPFLVTGNALLLDEHRGAHGTRGLGQLLPVADPHLGHRLAGLVGGKQRAQRRRHRAAALTGGIGEHVDQLGRVQQLLAAEDGAGEGDRRVAHAVAAQRHIQPVVQQRRGVELHRRLAQEDIALQPPQRRLVGQGQRAPVVGHGAVVIRQVVRVEDDLLQIDLGPAHAQRVVKAEVGGFHADKLIEIRL